MSLPNCIFCRKIIRGHALQCCGAGNFAHNACYDLHVAPASVTYYRRLKAGEINWFGTEMQFQVPYRLSDLERAKFRKALRLLGQPTDEAKAETDGEFAARYRARFQSHFAAVGVADA